MEAKKFLRQYKEILVDIRNMEAELRELCETGISITSHIEMVKVRNSEGKPEEQGMERVQSSRTGDKVGNLIARISELEAGIIERRSMSLDKLQEIEDVIQAVSNKDYRQILHRRYIEQNTWEQIAVAMNYSYQWICILHGRALQEVKV